MVAGPNHRSICCLPEEIIEQIILRVQCIKSIVRCLSVSRSWYGLIRSRRFINTHLCKKKYLLCFHEKSLPPSYYTQPCDQSIYYDDSEAEFQEYRRLEYPTKPLFVDGCNGLICYNTSSDQTRLYLWNPSIRKVKRVPASPRDHAYYIMHQFSKLTFRLWFDSKTNDYEIMRIIYTDRTTTVELYSLNRNSWKLISNNAPVMPTEDDTRQLTCVNGVWYWMVYNNNNWMLTWFNTKTWIFSQFKTNWRCANIYLRASSGDDRLLIIGYGDRYNLGHDGSMPSRCTNGGFIDQRLAKFRPLVRDLSYTMSLGFRNNGELLLQDIRSTHHLNIVSYNFETRICKFFVQGGITHRLQKVIPFCETLDLLDDADAAATTN